MPNLFKTTSLVAKEALRLLKNKKMVTEAFDTSFEKEFHKEYAVGSQIQVKFPQRFIPVDGMGYQPQAINRITTTVNLDQWVQIAFEIDDLERAISLERSDEEIKAQYIDPLTDALVQEIDSRAAKFAYQNASNVVGVLGTDATSINNYISARQRLVEKGNSAGKRWLCVSPSAMASYVQNNVTQFNPTDAISKMYKSGVIGTAAGWEWYESVSLWQHTAGTWAGAVTVKGAGQSGTSLVITATAGDTFNVGDKFKLNAVNSVNPVTRRTVGSPSAMNFTVTQALVAAGGGVDVLNFLPAIFGPGSQYQNVDALAIDGAALTLWPGTAAPNGKVGTVSLGLTKDAFALVGAKLYMPKAVEVAGRADDPVSGLSIRFVKAWDPVRSMVVQRADMLFGFGNLYQDNGAVCIAGA